MARRNNTNRIWKNEIGGRESKLLENYFLKTGNAMRNEESKPESTQHNDPASTSQRFIKRNENNYHLNMDKSTGAVHKFTPNSHSGRNRNRNSNNNRPRKMFQSVQRERDSSVESNISVQSNVEGRQQHNKPMRRFQIGFRKLIELYEKEPYDILLALNDKQGEFDGLLKSNDLSPDLIVLIVKVLSKVCNTTLEMKTKILLLFCHYFVEQHLIKYIMNLPLQSRNDKFKNKFFWDHINEFWNNTFILLNEVIRISPNTALDKFPRLMTATEMTLTQLKKNNVTIDDEILDEVDNISTLLTNVKSNEDVKKIKKTYTLENIEEPPDDYRTISLYPESTEIAENMEPYLRPNIVNGAYNDTDHYLDIQFRLFREDFVRPLRVAINECINQPINGKRRRIENIKIYEGITFEQSEVTKDKSNLLINLNIPAKNKKFLDRLEFSKRFMFGSLLVLTNDLFKTFFFATVSNRDIKNLKNGLIAVELQNNVTDNVFNKKFVMVESETYFEPYYHGLRALQFMYEYNFPMKKYIVDVETQNKLPRYLEMNPNLKIGLYQVNVLLNNWPTADQLDLDSSQHRALKSALTNEFSIIQGPPGTGKTFLGLEIAKILLKNLFWFNNSGNKSQPGKPILVVCYTNHALDQFLEEITKITNRVIRVGGQSKNENLKPYNIREKRVPFRKNNPHNNGAIRRLRMEVNESLEVINNINEQIRKLNDNNVIFDIGYYFLLVDESNWFTCANKYQLLDWLFPRKDQCTLYIKYDKYEDSPILCDLQKYNIAIEALTTEMKKIEQIDDIGFGYNDEINKLNEKRNSLINNLYYLQDRLNSDVDISNFQLENYDLYAPFVNCDIRWAIYWHVKNLYRNTLYAKLHNAQVTYREVFLNLREAQRIEDIEVMRHSLVVGMTTSCAAREHIVIQELQSPIVIVEEAAEVSETHILVSLTQHCQHLILIGDHKQLRPPVTVYKLAKDYFFDISLFERMINNNIQFETLEVQHRMRPDIAKLIVPAIYPSLINHTSVFKYPDVIGITKNMYFVTHNEFETQTDDLLSKQNIHEADFLLSLCRHLILQGYKPDEITILATYNGQMFYMRKERNKFPLLKDVRMTVVDNFQGEENRIILLSLVRSNEEKKIGFLSVANRICVALSRAKEGFFMIGNMDILAEKSKLWQQIKNVLSEQDMIGPSLTLRCQIHFNQLTEVRTTTDFIQSPEGGCQLPCALLLNCGHTCSKLCHIIDREHTEYKCRQKCTKVCDLNHPCPKDCYIDCPPCKILVPKVLPCGHEHNIACHIDPEEYSCPTLLKITLPLCEHEVEKPCFSDINTFKCTIPCENRLPCGHQCTLRCHLQDDPDHLNYKCYKDCERLNSGCLSNHKCQKRCWEECDECKIKQKKKRSHCNHIDTVDCNVDVDITPCEKPCKRKMSCVHECRSKCYEMCDPSLCKEKVKKIISPCKHYQTTLCGKAPDRKQCNGKCPLKLSCGHTCNNKCNKCVNGCDHTRCTGLINNPFPAICGHTFKIPCYKSINRSSDYNSFVFQNNILKHCNSPCNTTLKCGHKCNGTCGKCFQGKIHSNCTEDCGITLICGHPCEQPCRENCLPCSKPCQYSCTHSKCNNKCGEPCVSCKEKCNWSCKHYKCTKLCYEICNRPPCYEPCTEELKCGHQCIGICGEPCPLECRICDEETVTEIFFGSEDEPDARFILLHDCKHIVEVTSLEQFLMMEQECKKEGRKIDGVKVCPKCKTPINKTKRYSNIVKKTYFDIQNIKRKQFGNYNLIDDKRRIVMAKIIRMKESPVIEYVPGLLELLNDTFEKLKPVKNQRKQPMSLVETEALDDRIDIIKDIINILTKVCSDYPPATSAPLLIQTALIVQVLSKTVKITTQVIDDINREIDRLTKIRNLYIIENSPMYKSNKTNITVVTMYNEASRVIYTMDKIFSSDIKSEATKLLLKLTTFLKATAPPSDEERKAIMRAVGLPQGHWFECPNGHYYAIGECGGPMQVSKCVECKSSVGGTQHTLLRNNKHARVDGSSHPAWSDQANMNNYNFDHI